MKLLIITQKVDQNDDVLGFFIEWIREFSKKFDGVTVICLKMGTHDLPGNVRVLSLGKERGVSKLAYLANFYKYIIGERKNYDAVFAHMNPMYIPLGWPVWKILGKKISLWYAHGHVPLMLKIADKLTDISFASTKGGYRINSGKLKVVGQGIDTGLFKPNFQFPISSDGKAIENPRQSRDNFQFKIVSVGRVSPSKDYGTLIEAVMKLKESSRQNVIVEIAGQPATNDDIEYLKSLENLVKEKGLEEAIKFIGPIANRNLPDFLQSADLFVNMSHTGSLDKAILEAMSSGLIVLTCNEALKEILSLNYSDLLMYPKRDSQKLAEKIEYVINMSQEERGKISGDLRDIVVKNHNLVGLIKKISETLR